MRIGLGKQNLTFQVGDYLMDKQGNEVTINSLEQHIDPDGYEVVQLDVEPDDFYVGQTFLVHNKGSDDEPTYPSTKFTTAPGDRTIAGSLGDTIVVDEAMTIQLANGSGNTALQNLKQVQEQLHLQSHYQRVETTGTSGTDNSGTGFVTFPKTTILSIRNITFLELKQ